jgi:hypothetical protein
MRIAERLGLMFPLKQNKQLLVDTKIAEQLASRAASDKK